MATSGRRQKIMMTSNDLSRPLVTSYTQCQHESNILTSRGFQKCITCLLSVNFEIWPLTTSHDLKRPRIWKMLVDLRNWQPQLSKNIAYEKSQKIQFSKPFSSTSSVGWNGPQTKFSFFPSPHPSCLMPQSSVHLTAPQFSCFLESELVFMPYLCFKH